MTDANVLCKYDEMLDPKMLTAHPDNPNEHSKEQVKRLAKLLRKGFRAPIIISKNSKFIVKGHGTTLAAIHAGFKKVPVVFQEFFTPDEEYAFVVSDNAIAQWAELDLGKINMKLGDLGPDFDLEDFGLADFGIDPPQLEVDGKPTGPQGVESTNGGGINALRLFFTPEDHSTLMAKAADVQIAKGCTDLSELFKVLVEEAYEAGQ